MAQAAQGGGSTRTRTILTIAIVLLLVLLIGLVTVFFRVLRPAGGAEGGTGGGKMEWVRSLYGYGPAEDSQLLSPSSVAIAPNGDIYATDQIRSRVMVFNADGTFDRLLHTGMGGPGPKQFMRPEAVATDEAGNVYIADSMANKVIVFDGNGDYLREWPLETQGRGIWVSDGKAYVLGAGTVFVFDTGGKKLGSFGTRGYQNGQIDAYQGIAARDGKIYIADSYNKRLQAFDEKGKLLWAVPSKTGRSAPGTQTAETGDESASKAVPDHRWDLPQDLTFDGNGNLVVADAFQFEIAVVNPETGKVEARYGEFGKRDGQLFYPTSIAYDPARDWFAVADTGNNRVQVFEIPGSGGGGASALWRASSSPFRYLLIPALLLIFAIAVAVWMGLRMLRNREE